MVWTTVKTIGMKATKQYFPVVLFMLCKVFLTFQFEKEILELDLLNESYWPILCSGYVNYAVQGGSNYWVCGWNPKVEPFKRKLLNFSSKSCFFTSLYVWKAALNGTADRNLILSPLIDLWRFLIFTRKEILSFLRSCLNLYFLFRRTWMSTGLSSRLGSVQKSSWKV